MNAGEIKRLLPEVFQSAAHKESPLEALLQTMADMLKPTEVIFESFEDVLSPWQPKEDFIPYLGSWLYLHQYYSFDNEGKRTEYLAGVDQLRNLIAAFTDLSRVRGTARGLEKMLILATGFEGFQVTERVLDERGKTRPFHIQVSVPRLAEELRGLVDLIVRSEKPAYITYELKFVNLN